MTSKAGSVPGKDESSNQDGAPKTDCDLECSICLQTAIHPVELPCKHIFCYLCVKGTANRSKRCALCRQEIPQDYIYKPTLLKKEDLTKETAFEDGHQWYYEGNRGWWQYDERTSAELEVKFIEKCEKLEILIAGFLYVVDFENMYQYRRNDPSRRRKIKRDLISIPKKGVAGIRIKNSTHRPGGDGNDEDNANQGQATGYSSTQNSQSGGSGQSNISQQGANVPSYDNSSTSTDSNQSDINRNSRDIQASGTSHVANSSALSLLPESRLELAEVHEISPEVETVSVGDSSVSKADENVSGNSTGNVTGGNTSEETEMATETIGQGIAGMTLDEALANTNHSRGHGMQLRQRNRNPFSRRMFGSPTSSEDSEQE